MNAYSDSKKRATKMKWDFDLTSQFVFELMLNTKICPYFNVPLTYIGKTKTLASIDRKNSNLGYTKDNICIVSYLANLMKSNATHEELEKFSHGIINMKNKS